MKSRWSQRGEYPAPFVGVREKKFDDGASCDAESEPSVVGLSQSGSGLGPRM